MHIRESDKKIFSSLPAIYKKPEGGTVSGFNRLGNTDLIERFGVYPVAGEPTLAWWQTKSDPQYTFTETEAQVSYTLTDMPFSDRQDTLINQVYSQARSLIESQEQGYAQSEIATWPMMRAEVKQYNIDATVGPNMQLVVDEGTYDAASLAAMLTPKVNFYDAVIAERNNKVQAIKDAEDQPDLDLIDIAAGWPTIDDD
jgi:hypothetical protein